jgi:acyl carrier protein
VAPRTPTEEALAKIWTSLLGVKQVGIHDNFFELGGHSLLATQVVSRVRENLRVEIPLRRIFEAPTIEQLALSIVMESLQTKDEQDLERLLTQLEQAGDVEVASA